MSYLVLARKWRPQGFDDLVGQEPITRILEEFPLSEQDCTCLYILRAKGRGQDIDRKDTCKSPELRKRADASPCGVCASCTAIKDGSSIDVLEIDGASNNSVDDIRDLRKALNIRHWEAGTKYILLTKPTCFPLLHSMPC